jgi:hypothetical protein
MLWLVSLGSMSIADFRYINLFTWKFSDYVRFIVISPTPAGRLREDDTISISSIEPIAFAFPPSQFLPSLLTPSLDTQVWRPPLQSYY